MPESGQRKRWSARPEPGATRALPVTSENEHVAGVLFHSALYHVPEPVRGAHVQIVCGTFQPDGAGCDVDAIIWCARSRPVLDHLHVGHANNFVEVDGARSNCDPLP